MAAAKKAEKLFEAAVAGVESASIREWATKPGHREAWIKYVGAVIEKKPKITPTEITTVIVCEAIGLW